MPVFVQTFAGFGTIPIERHEMLSFRTSMTLNQYLSQRVNTNVLTVPQANQYDYYYMSLRVDAAKYSQWLAYFSSLPTNLQRQLLINYTVGVLGAALETMEVEIEKIVNDGTGQYDYIYKLDLTFVRSI